MHGVHHQLQGWINNRAGFFRIEAFDQRCRPFKISKQGRDRFAFTVVAPCFQRCLLGTNALGEMPRV